MTGLGVTRQDTSDVLDRLTTLFEAGHRETLTDLRDDGRYSDPASLRPAAVLMAVTESATPSVLMIHRPSNMRAHPGQAAFPGGKLDPGEDAVQAALREANEELGIDPALVRVIGPTDRYRTATGYDITPVLATVPEDIAIHPNPTEVAGWFAPPVDFVLDRRNHLRRSAEWNGIERHYLEIIWEGHRIWGVTAAILANLSRRIAWAGAAHG